MGGAHLTWRLVRQVVLLMAVAAVAALAVAPAVASIDASALSPGAGQRRLTLIPAEAVGPDRTFRATLESSVPGGWQAVAGEEITFAYVTDGAGTVIAVNGGPGGSMRCATDFSGRCTITVRTDVPGEAVVAAVAGSLSASVPLG